MATVKSVAERARKAGKHAAIYLTDPKAAPRLADMGYRLFACGSEHQLIARGAEVVLGAAKAALGSEIAAERA